MSVNTRAARAARMAARHPQADENFLAGLNAVFATWTALELAVHHEWGGPNSREKAERMIDEVYDMFQQPDEVFRDEIAFILEDHLDEQFHTTCEDGSTEEIGEILVRLYRECGLGNFTLSNSLQARAAARVPQVHRSKGVETGDEIDSDEEGDGLTIDDINDGSIPTMFPFGGGGGQVGGGAAGSSMEGDEMDSNSNNNSSGGRGNRNNSNNYNPGPDPDGWETVRKGGRKK